MKKKMAGLLAALMVLVMGTTTVFAAVSPTTETLKDNIKDATSTSGDAEYSVVLDTVSDTVKAAAYEEAVKAETVPANEESSATVLALAEVSIPDLSETQVSKGVTLTFGVNGVNPGDNVYALHQKKDGTWEVCPTIVGKDKVTVTLYSLSPIAIVKYDNGRKITTNQVINGKDGADGKDGTDGKDGADGKDGTNGINGTNGTNGSDGTNGTNGINGTNGKDGVNGKDGKDGVVINNYYTTGGATGTTSNASNATSPKTGSSLPVLPIAAVLTLMGIAVCGKKTHSL